MLRISTTTIDEFRKLLTESDYTEENLIQYITGEFKATKYMQLGSAFHEIIEKPSEAYLRFLNQNVETTMNGFLAKNGIFYPWDSINPCIDKINYDFPFEVKTTINYNIDGVEIEVVCKVDQLVGITIKEFKTAWSYFGSHGWKSFVEQYEASIQWKLYLEAFEIDDVDYHVFLFNEKDSNIELEDIISFSFQRYENMDQDIYNTLSEFLNFIKLRNLESYFQIKNLELSNGNK